MLVSIVAWLNPRLNQLNRLRAPETERQQSVRARTSNEPPVVQGISLSLTDFAGKWRIVEGPKELMSEVTHFELTMENGKLLAVGFDQDGSEGFTIDEGRLYGDFSFNSVSVQVTGVLSANKEDIELMIDPPLGPDLRVRAERM